MHKNVMYLGQIRENSVHQSGVQENSCQKSFFVVLVLYIQDFMVRFRVRLKQTVLLFSAFLKVAGRIGKQ